MGLKTYGVIQEGSSSGKGWRKGLVVGDMRWEVARVGGGMNIAWGWIVIASWIRKEQGKVGGGGILCLDSNNPVEK
jgi:hypothetical protein